MNRFFLNNMTMNSLNSIIAGKGNIDSEEEMEKLAESFKEAGVIVENEDGEEVMDDMCQIMIETYLTASNKVVLHCNKDNQRIMRAYYLAGDIIVMLTAYKEGGEFVWLPTIGHVAGSLAQLMDGIEYESIESFEAAGPIELPFDENNYKEVLPTAIPEGEYKDVLLTNDKKGDIWLKCCEGQGKPQSFIYVVYSDNSIYYYRHEYGVMTYGKTGEAGIVNIMNKWMLNKHREQILELVSEK